MSGKIYLLGGHQTDFATNWLRQDREIFDVFRDTLNQGLNNCGLDYDDLDCGHVGNFNGELFNHQGIMGGYFGMVDPKLSGLPTGRHEAACASGSIALLAATAELEAGRYGLACVMGIEQMRNVSGAEAAAHLGSATWFGHECQNVKYPWPHMFGKLGDEYDKRYGLKHEHLAGIAKINFANGRRNPNAQTRGWQFSDNSFTEDNDLNPIIDGRIRKQDCGQVTDGAAVLFLATEERAIAYADRRGISVSTIPYIEGWGHRSAPLALDQKMTESAGADYVFPHIRGTITDAYQRAGLTDVSAIDVIETHDCFTTTEYMAIDHFGITAPGESWKAIEDGRIAMDGEIPINPSGGLIGCGHPVGATGVRMLLDACKQVTDTAGNYQVADARRVQTLNIGGSGTTSVSFIVSKD
ncbi:acetyl-CoA acetyltransferase [Paremcibacter congregatus]|uniref:acetyl-CoA acetyltransferase n=1 Tax=Paremcibacter congregatus TaxID=2043170 RepID=UPI0030EE440F|tara:strand:+ start:376 stop:1608 length:1233 start_codon:yes stop_codon:yes gene_type:complete